MEEKKLTIEDCLIDWDHYETKDEKGNPVVIAVSKEQQDEWLHEDCGCNEINKADRAKCTAYYTFNYKREKLDAYYESIGKANYVANYPIWGLIAMFNDGWLKSPAYVDWADMYMFVGGGGMSHFIHSIKEPQTRVDIMNYMIQRSSGYDHRGSSTMGDYKALLAESKEALKIRKQELASQKKAKKEKPEYVLSVEEIIQYVREENPDAAPAVRAMLRYFADEKEGWNSKSVKALLEPIKAQNINIYAPVGQVNANVEHQTNTLRE